MEDHDDSALHRIAQTQNLQAAVREVASRVEGFAAEMRALGYHVGLNGSCVICREPWPCAHIEDAPRPAHSETPAHWEGPPNGDWVG